MISKKITIYFLLMIALLVASIPLVSCSGTVQPSDTTSIPASETRAPSENEVIIESNTFKPADITIKVGETITWINKDSYNHTIEGINGEIDSGNMASGEEFSFTFNNEGTFDYICGIHTFMKGKVTVTK